MRSAGNEEKPITTKPMAIAMGEKKSALYSSRRGQSALASFAKGSKALKKHPFALAEVCIAIVVIGVSISYVFTSMHQSIQRYATLRDEILCNELADEHLARSLARFLTTPPPFDTANQNVADETLDGNYVVELLIDPSESSKDRDKERKNEKDPEIAKPVSLISLKVSVHPLGKTEPLASRTTELCITKEGV